MKKGSRFLAIVVMLIVMPTCTESQIHPSKQAYVDWETWPVTTPDQVDLGDSFRPFRAVWSREYRNMNGEMRSDQIVLVAEELSWYGRRVISLTPRRGCARLARYERPYRQRLRRPTQLDARSRHRAEVGHGGGLQRGGGPRGSHRHDDRLDRVRLRRDT